MRLTGVGRVVDLQFDARDDAAGFVAVESWKDPATSAVVLLVGDTRIAPKALSSTPSKEGVITVDSLTAMTGTGRGLWMCAVSLQPKLLLLFDVPKDIAAGAATLVADIELIDLTGKGTPVRIQIRM